jgi:hypothetical protein
MRRPSPTLLPSLAALLALGAGVVAGCGGGDPAVITIQGQVGGGPPPGATPPVPRAFQVPPGVPRASDGQPTDAVSRRVIRKWLSALRQGDIARAARFFAVPSKVQNGTPVLTLRSPRARAAFNENFPCGARATKLEHAGRGFTVVEFVLTQRVGADCGSGTGNTARSAIRVARGHIVEWYRLDDLTVPVPGPGGLDPGAKIA